MAEVALYGVSKRFGATSAVSDLSLTVDYGAFVVLLGPTGACKTTTLRLVAGLERPDAGRIRIAGQDVTSASPAQRDVAFIFQQYSLYPHLSVFDNLAFPLRSPARRSPEPRIRQRVNEVAALLRISEKLDERVTKLSGGQTQRVRFAIALVADPDLLVLDEPTAALDVEGRRDFWTAMRAVAARGKTIVFATHYLEEADAYADRIVLMARGKVVADGPATEIKALAGDRIIRATLPASPRSAAS